MKASRSLVLSVLVALLSLGGCALSPQEISPSPLLDVGSLPRDGANDTVALSVADKRANPVLGYRGGVYETATVTLSADTAARLRAQVAQALTARGFKVAAADAPANVRLEVELTAMSYKSVQGQITRTVEVATTIKGRSKVGDITRSNEYRDARTKEFVKPPTEAENESFVNESIAAALQRMLADVEFLKR